MEEPEDIVDRLRENADLDAMEHVPADIVQMQRDAVDEILRLRNALRLVMACAGGIDKTINSTMSSDEKITLLGEGGMYE